MALSRDQLVRRAAQELREGYYVNPADDSDTDFIVAGGECLGADL